MVRRKKFSVQVRDRIRKIRNDPEVQDLSQKWMRQSIKHRYSYNFSWMGRPIIQYPADIVAMQELIWSVKPDLIIETGIAHGGSLILHASLLALLDISHATASCTTLDPKVVNRMVLGIDIDIRKNNRRAIQEHPMASRIQMIEGSSIDPEIVSKVKEIAKNYKRVLVSLDSNHTHEHVLAELKAYAELTSLGSYCVVFDTVIEDMPLETFPDRSWGPGNNPKTAVWKFLDSNQKFEIDRDIEQKLLVTVAPDGFLKRVR